MMSRYHLNAPIVITPPEILPGEARALFALVEAGAGVIHIRKPGAPERALHAYLAGIHPEILHHLTIHHRADLAGAFGLGGVHVRPERLGDPTGTLRKSASCHDWEEVKSCTGRADYVFLSPVFDSHSKAGYRAAFAGEQLRLLLADRDRPPVVALGGIDPLTAPSARAWGFEGAAAIGSLWALREGRIDTGRTVANYKALTSAWNGTK